MQTIKKIELPDPISANRFQEEFQWLKSVIELRIMEVSVPMLTNALNPPSLKEFNHPYADFILKNELSNAERLVLALSLIPHIYPEFLDQTLQEAIPESGDFPQIGGTRGQHFRGFLPTGETALFLLTGKDLDKRADAHRFFNADHLFAQKNVLWLEDIPEGEPRMSARIVVSKEYIEWFTTGTLAPPRFSLRFPAKRIETLMEWDDLVLNEKTLNQIRELEKWIMHGDKLLYDWGMIRKLKPGYRALFHGPPGTGKTLTASLLGKYTGKEVYKIDLSMVVSKFIGETEKNLANLFEKAESKDWILFFDEADALFGKRTNVRDAHDKYANQEVSYLLQRVETFNGLIILASNFKTNIDDAFVRRFQSIIHFPMPNMQERMLLWQKAFPEKASLCRQVNLSMLSRKYELTGAEIMNVVQYCCMSAICRGGNEVGSQDFQEGIRKEFEKGGKIMR